MASQLLSSKRASPLACVRWMVFAHRALVSYVLVALAGSTFGKKILA